MYFLKKVDLFLEYSLIGRMLVFNAEGKGSSPFVLVLANIV